MPDTSFAFRDHGRGSLVPIEKLLHLLLGLAYKILTPLQKLNTDFHLGHPDIAEVPQNFGKKVSEE